MTPSDNEELILRLRHKNADAFVQIVRMFEQPMLRTAFRILGQQADAEEVRQTILLRIWESPEKIPEVNSFDHWIRRCVVNESIELIRRRERERRRYEHSSRLNVTAVEPAGWSDETIQLKNALAELDPEQRAILSLRFDEECTIREMATILEQPHTTVQSKLSRAISQLRSLLKHPVEQVE